MRKINSAGEIANLCREALYMEEFLEQVHNRHLFDLFGLEYGGEEGLDEVQNRLFEIKLAEGNHLNLFESILEGLGEEVDVSGDRREAYSRVELFDRGTLETTFEKAIQVEFLTGRYFEFTAAALENASVDGVNTDRMAKSFRSVSREEYRHRQILEELLDDYDEIMGKEVVHLNPLERTVTPT